MFKVLGPIAHEICNEHRDIVVVTTEQIRQGFYRSTGRSSGRPGVWFPFDGLCFFPGHGLWFVKSRFILPEQLDSPLYRFGDPELLRISDELCARHIPASTDVRSEEAVNLFLANDRTSEFNQTIHDFKEIIRQFT